MTAAISETSLPKVITYYVQQQFDKEGTGLLLSRLGQTLTQQHPELKAQLGSKKLAEFLARKMADSVRVVVSPHDAKVSIVLPTTAELGGDLSRYFPQRRAISTVNAPVVPRYNRAVWAAFSQPVIANATRWLSLEPVVSFADLAQLSSLDGGLAIASEFIVTSAQIVDPAQRARKIAENIELWAKQTGTAAALLLASAKSTINSSVVSEKLSLLDLLLASLEESELKRIQIPLDVIAKLHRSKK